MMRRVLALLLSALMLLSLWGCQKDDGGAETTEPTKQTVAETKETQPEETQPHEPGGNGPSQPEGEPSSPLMYKATDAEGNTVYLLGSIHVGTEEMYPLPEYVLDAYEESDALAVECDVVAEAADMAGAVASLKPMVLTDGTKISDHISQECYDLAVEILKDNHTYFKMLDMYKPVLWFSLISSLAAENAGAKADLGVDMYFLTDAHETGKTIYEIESSLAQMELLGNLSMDLQALLLEGTVYSYDLPEYGQSLLDMCHAWAIGDAEGLLEEGEDETAGLTPEEIALVEEFNESLEGQRNVNMTQYAMDALASGETVFIVVGAAHVLGDDGMVASLEEAGYTVTRVE